MVFEMDNKALMVNTIKGTLLDPDFIANSGMDSGVMQARTAREDFVEMVYELYYHVGRHGRYDAKTILGICSRYTPELEVAPPEGWLEHTRKYLLNLIFPHLEGPIEPERYKAGRNILLQLMRGVYQYERQVLPFDPCYDINLLSDEEVVSKGFTDEYLTFSKLVKSNYVYEFMRLSSDISPFNTLGHISGVHYVAMYTARQLYEAGINVDLALVSAAAASHDIGKYGCRKEEERRVPYLHYYYTDYCLTRFGLPTIMHIAANHSTWDLEIENLSVESLLLIYADFRVRSTRDEDEQETINFFTLEEAFDVVLTKLDNINEAKNHRYEKVYNKLLDFEEFMCENGVTTVLPEDWSEAPRFKCAPKVKELALLNGAEATSQLKFRAIEHNIRLMKIFNNPAEFSSLIERARSEMQWSNIRTYLNILGEYKAYMTEDQKVIVLDFMYDMLFNRESDLREQAAQIMGQIVARFREEYKKELPKSVPTRDSDTTNIAQFSSYLEKLVNPSIKHTDFHRKRIIEATPDFVNEVIKNCRPSCRSKYFDVLERYYHVADLDEQTIIVLCTTALIIDKSLMPESFLESLMFFTKDILNSYSPNTDLLALAVIERFFPDSGMDVESRRLSILGIPKCLDVTDALPSSLFLDNLKTNTSWISKIANIDYMFEVAKQGDNVMHIATHFVNLIKVSEVIAVRKHAGDCLLELAAAMPSDQINELCIDLFNGLELSDYQFLKFIPGYLGQLMMYQSDNEQNEAIDALEILLNTGSSKSAAASLNTMGVLLENFDKMPKPSKNAEKHKKRLLGMIVKSISHYNTIISQEALRVLGIRIFGSTVMNLESKSWVASHCFKRLVAMIPLIGDDLGLEFYNNSAVLNYIYRFIATYVAEVGAFEFKEYDKVAFFPGTFDPFTLGHKAIATTIRDMGFEVYLVLDEFSWTRKTLPRALRKNILAMSISSEEELNVFPDDIQVNLANADDLRKLRELFAGKDLYIVTGSDAIENAACYKAAPSEYSIHSLGHIVFERESSDDSHRDSGDSYPITGEIIKLHLKKYSEDVSSARIRNNIDLGRDIGTLLDPVVQNYIYDMNLYKHEPAYKEVLTANDINFSVFEHMDAGFTMPLSDDLETAGYDLVVLSEYLDDLATKSILINARPGEREEPVLSAFASARKLRANDLLEEFGSSEIASTIRKSALGSIASIGAFYAKDVANADVSNLKQILLTEIMTELLDEDYTYVIYRPVDHAGMDEDTIDLLIHHGFVDISSSEEEPIYAVDMKAPIVLFRDVESCIKAPFNKNPRIIKAADDAHTKLLRTFNELFPGKLILTFNPSAVYSRIVNMVTSENGVPEASDPLKKRGPYMAVPYGKALSDVVIPNTVTKALRTDKYFKNDLSGFTIREYRNYAPLQEQIKTIKSFEKPAILVDDFLHNGQRLNHIAPLIKDAGIDLRKVIVGVLTGRALDTMKEREIPVEGAYFLPDISIWINEHDSYPFFGGDSLELVDDSKEHGTINLMLPYTTFSFVGENDMDKVYKYSITCLENARDILRILEQEYQAEYGRKLTQKQLGAVISRPCTPMLPPGLEYDSSFAASDFIENDIRRAERLHMFKK